MPAISMFYGIVIYMYYFDDKMHNFAHIHAKYQENEAVIEIPEGHVLEGSLPSIKLNLFRHR